MQKDFLGKLPNFHDSIEQPWFPQEIIDSYLSPSATIILNQPFESALVKIQNFEEDQLTTEEKAAVEKILKAGVVHPKARDIANIVDAMAQRKKARGLKSSCYGNTSFIPPTSNVVERLFSQARLRLGHVKNNFNDDTELELYFIKARI